jgi:transposase-like protein
MFCSNDGRIDRFCEFSRIRDTHVIDILVQSRRNRRAAGRFFRKLLKNQGKVPFRLVTDKVKSYGAALRTIMSFGQP